MKDQTQVDGMAKTLYGSGLIKEASSTSTSSSDSSDINDIDTEDIKKDKLIREAGKAAYRATISKSALSDKGRRSRMKNNNISLPKVSE